MARSQTDDHDAYEFTQDAVRYLPTLLDALEKTLEVLEEYARPMHVTEWDGGHKARTVLAYLGANSDANKTS